MENNFPLVSKKSDASVNANISSQEYSLQYVRLDDAIRILLKLGPKCFMAKPDVKSAFRNTPVHPDDWELLGMKWCDLYFFDCVLPFGLRSAPFIFNMLSDAVEWILIHKLGVSMDDFKFLYSRTSTTFGMFLPYVNCWACLPS